MTPTVTGQRARDAHTSESTGLRRRLRRFDPAGGTTCDQQLCQSPSPRSPLRGTSVAAVPNMASRRRRGYIEPSPSNRFRAAVSVDMDPLAGKDA
jgi:hypothetical protein